ncbi:MAG TPA: RNA 2',3'-cyclic phosphodiesterase [Solirubrobacterales bacterium]
MAKDRLKSPRTRMFVALDLPEETREGIVAWGKKALSDSALRPLGADALHVTLAFLSWQPLRVVERLEEILAESRVDSPRMELRDPVPVPPRGRPRLFALPVESPGTMALQADLEERLVVARLYKPEKRPFWAHVTVARVRREERGSSRPARVSDPPGPLPKRLLRPIGGVRLTLYRSQLQSQGAQYTPLAQVELPDRGRQ